MLYSTSCLSIRLAWIPVKTNRPIELKFTQEFNIHLLSFRIHFCLYVVITKKP